ncbi:unnamed protein product [Cladocopium goreaui]|uniref:PDZ domain-containing protein n=1 Tax=Cladocopium goreaui TaxID=2562237 RepID=A0A9P1CJ32_9DINO|nr:unnamed protein product [Cladocopium goreaui]
MFWCCARDDAAVTLALDNANARPTVPVALSDELVLRLNSDELKRLDLDLSDPKCIILASCDGAAADWNQRSPNQIFPFDRIVKIDGKQCESQDFLDILSRDKGSLVELSVERPLKHLLYLKKPGRLGLDLMFTKVDAKPWRASVKPWIASISNDGLVAEWNASMPELAISEHDRIISINSKAGSPGELVDVLSAAEVIEMEVLHYNF